MGHWDSNTLDETTPKLFYTVLKGSFAINLSYLLQILFYSNFNKVNIYKIIISISVGILNLLSHKVVAVLAYREI